jgi:hypothetical protein
MDEAIRQLLIRELPVKNGEIDIDFDQPRREWSARLNRPTLNVFLYDVREHVKLRSSQQWRVERLPDGTAVQRRPPVKVRLNYMITAWAANSDDEHNLLARALMVFFRNPIMPQELLPEGLLPQPTPVQLEVSEEDLAHKPVDVWTVLDNDLRPSITLMVILTADPFRPTVTPLVRTRELRLGQSLRPATETLVEEAGVSVFWTIGGRIHTDQPLEDLQLTLLEQGITVPLQEEGRFSIGQLRAGDYTLEVRVDGKKPKQHKITVPAPDYDLEV